MTQPQLRCWQGLLLIIIIVVITLASQTQHSPFTSTHHSAACSLAHIPGILSSTNLCPHAQFMLLMPLTPGARERLSKLPDEERRVQAAALALRFAAMLGGSDDDEEDDTGDGFDEFGDPLRTF